MKKTAAYSQGVDFVYWQAEIHMNYFFNRSLAGFLSAER
jgi:hypothetical protein